MRTATAAALLDTEDPRPVHFMGIAGAGMSALAELLVRRGVRVNGCDINPEPAADLRRLAVDISGEHSTSHLEGARMIVATSAIPRDHEELVRARGRGIPVLLRAEALAAVVNDATVIGIAGTHGKTTTTALTTDALAAAALEPTGIAGGRVSTWGGHFWRGGDGLFVVEADEYDRSFLSLNPTIAAVTNVEADHLDVYSDVAEIRRAFEDYLRPARAVVACADDHTASTLSMPSSAEIIRYGIVSHDARLRAVETAFASDGSSFDVRYDNRLLGAIRLKIPGRHNVLNALAAIGCGIAAGATLDAMRPGLEAFRGVERRFQRLGTVGDVTIVDDYAHHPTEIAATLEAARAAFPGARLVAAFQPHLFTRTRDFAPEFATALSAADVVFLTEIYPAREHAIPGVTSTLIEDALARAGRPVSWRGERSELADVLAEHARAGDVVVTLGAGDITQSAYALREKLASLKTART
jgi:UDP-N-acetylmuramate--alanine ligase